LFIKLDASHEHSFGIMVFHLKEGYKLPVDLAKIASTAIQPIMFLSKLLGSVEHNYHVLPGLYLLLIVYYDPVNIRASYYPH
jgi:hypothetical protein